MSKKPQNIWIVGCGDIGCRVADLYQKNGAATISPVRGIVRSEESMRTCAQHGIEVLQLDLGKDYQLPLEQLENAEIFYFVPPPPIGTHDPVLERYLTTIKNLPRRVVLISTTGVYGDSQGEWIDETTRVKPLADRAKRRCSAEQSIVKWADQNNREFMILRVPGIYARDRLPLARLQKGLPVVDESEAGWTNRIHADDLAQACKAAMQCEASNQWINITDGHPSSITDYFNQVADYAGLPRPPQITMQQAEETLSEGMLSYLKESRRIRNDKMLNVLKIKLKYPNLASALNSN